MRSLVCSRRSARSYALDPHQAAAVTDSTLQRYRRAARSLTHFICDAGILPNCAEDWDDALVMFKQCTRASKSDFETAVAAVEFFFPRFRGQMKRSRAIVKGWSIWHVPRHTVPLGKAHAKLVAVHVSALGAPALGLGIVVQRELGLRPSELLGLWASDLVLPEFQHAPRTLRVVVALGVRRGTKAKRPQAVLCKDPLCIGILRHLSNRSSVNSPIVPFSYAQYRKLLTRAQQAIQVDFGWTPHSPRAGFASEAIQDGIPFQEVKEAGRWLVDSSLRTYIDLVQTAQLAVDIQARGLLPAVDFASRAFFRFFPGLEADCLELRRDGGEVAGTGRELLPEVGCAESWTAPGRVPDSDESSEQENDEGRNATARVRFAESAASASAGKGKGPLKGRGRGKSATRN